MRDVRLGPSSVMERRDMSMLLWRDEGLCDMMMGLGGFDLIHNYECNESLGEAKGMEMNEVERINLLRRKIDVASGNIKSC